MAVLSSGIPSTCVYLVKPLLIASIALSFILSGVSKSGSPELKLITFSPERDISLAI